MMMMEDARCPKKAVADWVVPEFHPSVVGGAKIAPLSNQNRYGRSMRSLQPALSQ